MYVLFIILCDFVNLCIKSGSNINRVLIVERGGIELYGKCKNHLMQILSLPGPPLACSSHGFVDTRYSIKSGLC